MTVTISRLKSHLLLNTVVQASSAEQLSAEAKSSLPQYSQRSQLILFFYLLGYNQVSFLGWFWVLYTTLFRLFSTGFEYERVHELVWPALVIVQSGAVIEIINSAFRTCLCINSMGGTFN